MYVIQADRTVCMKDRGSLVPSVMEVRNFLWRSCLAVGELGKFKVVLTCRGSGFEPESRTPLEPFVRENTAFCLHNVLLSQDQQSTGI